MRFTVALLVLGYVAFAHCEERDALHVYEKGAELDESKVIKCSTHKSCASCAISSQLFFGCQWCTTTNSCRAPWDKATCPKNNRVSAVYDCPIKPFPLFKYTDKFAREKALAFIGAANSDTEDQVKTCLKNRAPGAQLVSRYRTACDKKQNNCTATLAVSPKDRAIVLTFRGSEGAQQFLSEGASFFFYQQKKFEAVGGKVVDYFHDAFFALWNEGIEKDLVALRQKKEYKNYEVWVFGHSLGGALSSLASSYISKKGIISSFRLKSLSFGEPRAGDTTFAALFDLLVPYKYRVVHKGDLVAKLPFQLPVFPNTFFHHRFEVWYNNSMAVGAPFKICERADDPNCSWSESPTPLAATHNTYFGQDISKWYLTGCQ